MAANEFPQIQRARVDDLDLDLEADEGEWERRVAELAESRLGAARDRLEGMGIIDSDGQLRSRELPSDMKQDSETTLETG